MGGVTHHVEHHLYVLFRSLQQPQATVTGARWNLGDKGSFAYFALTEALSTNIGVDMSLDIVSYKGANA